MPDALSVVLHAAMLSSSSMALQLCAAVVKGEACSVYVTPEWTSSSCLPAFSIQLMLSLSPAGQAAWEEEVQQQCKNAKQTGQVNLAALLHLLENDVLSSTQCYRCASASQECGFMSAGSSLQSCMGTLEQ